MFKIGELVHCYNAGEKFRARVYAFGDGDTLKVIRESYLEPILVHKAQCRHLIKGNQAKKREFWVILVKGHIYTVHLSFDSALTAAMGEYNLGPIEIVKVKEQGVFASLP